MVDSTPITPITPGNTSVSQAISSANDAFVRIKDQADAVNGLLIDVGDKTSLTTSVKTDLVSAINEIFTRFNDGFLISNITGNLVDLTTTNKSTIVAAVNEVNGYVGDVDVLLTVAKTSVVAAINEIVSGSSGVGNLVNLSTTDKSSVVAAINELSQGIGSFSNLAPFPDVISGINDISGRIGDVDALNTTIKNDLVSAINDVVSKYSQFIVRDGSVKFTGPADLGNNKIVNVSDGTNSTDAATVGQILDIVKLGDIGALSTSTKENVVLAINEVLNDIGSLNLLTTTDKTSIVNAINELVANADYQDMQVKLSGLTSVKFGFDLATNRDQSFDFRSSTVTGPTEFDLRLLRASGSNGDASIINNGSGKILFSTKDPSNGIVPRVRVGTSATNPLEVWQDSAWTPVATGGATLPLVGGTMTGPIVFNKSLSSNNLIFDLMQGYALFSDNTGSYSGSVSRLWLDTPVTGEVHVGPKAGGTLKGINLHTDRLDVTGEIFSSTDITLLSDERVKTEVRTISRALDRVSHMRGVHYIKDEKFSTGVIAQELELVAPELVKETQTPEGYLSVNYQQMAGYFIEAIKELRIELEEARLEIRQLRRRL
jgi:hypothetical protein